MLMQGHLLVDNEYCNLSKKRNEEASARTRTVRSYEDNRANHLALVASKRAADLATKRKARAAKIVIAPFMHVCLCPGPSICLAV